MKEKVRFLGLDVHAETIAVAVAEQDGEVRGLGIIPNRSEAVRKLIRKLGSEEIEEIARKAQLRLHKRYAKLAAGGKDQSKIVTAVGRELLGFIWAVGVKTETAVSQAMAT